MATNPLPTQLLVLISVLLLLAGCTRAEKDATADEASRELSPDAMREDLHELHSAVSHSWAYLDSKRTQQNVNIDSLRDRLLSEINHDTTPSQFAMLLQKFVAGLSDGHAEVDLGPLGNPLPSSWPVGVTLVEGGVYVSNLNWLSENPGIEIGDELITVDGTPVMDILNRTKEVTSASTHGAKQVLAADRIHFTDKERVCLGLRKPSGDALEVTVECLPYRVDFRYRKQDSAIERIQLDDRLDLLRIRSFAWNPVEFSSASTPEQRDAALADAKEEIDQAFAESADADGIILDLRDNAGGYDLLSIFVAQHLVAGDFTYYKMERRDSPSIRALPKFQRNSTAPFGKLPPAIPRSWVGYRHYEGQPYTGPLIVLINERCFSSTDNLCAFLRDVRPQTRFVGRPTNGGTGEPTEVVKLTNCGARIRLCISRVYSPNGRLIEGHGTHPDYPVELTFKDLLANRDLDLEKAVAVFGSWERNRGG